VSAPLQETGDERIARLAADLALSLALRSEKGEPTWKLARLTGLTPGVVAGLIARAGFRR